METCREREYQGLSLLIWCPRDQRGQKANLEGVGPRNQDARLHRLCLSLFRVGLCGFTAPSELLTEQFWACIAFFHLRINRTWLPRPSRGGFTSGPTWVHCEDLLWHCHPPPGCSPHSLRRALLLGLQPANLAVDGFFPPVVSEQLKHLQDFFFFLFETVLTQTSIRHVRTNGSGQSFFRYELLYSIPLSPLGGMCFIL